MHLKAISAKGARRDIHHAGIVNDNVNAGLGVGENLGSSRINRSKRRDVENQCSRLNAREGYGELFDYSLDFGRVASREDQKGRSLGGKFVGNGSTETIRANSSYENWEALSDCSQLIVLSIENGWLRSEMRLLTCLVTNIFWESLDDFSGFGMGTELSF